MLEHHTMSMVLYFWFHLYLENTLGILATRLQICTTWLNVSQVQMQFSKLWCFQIESRGWNATTVGYKEAIDGQVWPGNGIYTVDSTGRFCLTGSALKALGVKDGKKWKFKLKLHIFSRHTFAFTFLVGILPSKTLKTFRAGSVEQKHPVYHNVGTNDISWSAQIRPGEVMRSPSHRAVDACLALQWQRPHLELWEPATC